MGNREEREQAVINRIVCMFGWFFITMIIHAQHLLTPTITICCFFVFICLAITVVSSLGNIDNPHASKRPKYRIRCIGGDYFPQVKGVLFWKFIRPRGYAKSYDSLQAALDNEKYWKPKDEVVWESDE